MGHCTFRSVVVASVMLCAATEAAAQRPPIVDQSFLPMVQVPETLLVGLQAHVVQITTEADAGTGGGFGIIVGARDGELVIATAGHVIYTELGEPRPHIRVELYAGRSAPGVIAPATLLPGQPPFDLGLDLALLRVPTPFKPQLVPFAASPRRPVAGEPLWLLGPVNAFRWSATPGITGSIASDDVVFTGGGVEQGASGAPVVSLGGIVGIARATGATSAAVPVATIRRAFDRAAKGYTWLLESAPDQPSPGFVLPTRLDQLPPNTGMPVLVGPTGREVMLAVDRWQQVPAGSYRLGGRQWARLACTPATVTVLPFDRRPLAISCRIDPTGLWRDAEGFQVVIVPAAGDRYPVRELDQTGVQIGSGDAVAFLDGRLQVNVISQLTGQWFAELMLGPDQATGRATLVDARTVKEVTWFRSDSR